MAKVSQFEYLEKGGAICPNCRSKDGIEGGPIEIDSKIAWQPISCADCDATWFDTYMLKGYSDLVLPDCDQCKELMINGVRCHETGCPNAKR